MGRKPVFNGLFELFGKRVVEPAIDDNYDGVGNCKIVPDISILGSEEREAVEDIAQKMRSKITKDNRERIKKYWDFWDSNVFEMRDANSNLLNTGLTYDNFFVDLHFREFMNEGFKKPNVAVFDVDNTLFLDGNLTYNPHSKMMGLMDMGVKLSSFNSPDVLFSDYNDMSDISHGGKKIISAEGIYDFQNLSKMDMHLSRGFAEIYNLHKKDGADAFFETKLQFLKEMCAHPEKTCISQTCFHDIMLLRKFYDTVAFITLSDNDVAKVLFEISDFVMPKSTDFGELMSIGSSFRLGARKIDLTDDNSLRQSVNLAFGPKKVNMLNNYFVRSGVSEKMRAISTISDILSSDPTAMVSGDISAYEDVCGLDYPLAVVAYGADSKQVTLMLTSDNVEDFSSLKDMSSEDGVGRVICNFVENDKNSGWGEIIEGYASQNGISFNKIEKATDVVTLELFEQSIKTMLLDYGYDGIKYICGELEGIKSLIDEYQKVGDDDILEDIKDGFESLYVNMCDKYHGDIYDQSDVNGGDTLFLKLLKLEIKDITKGYGGLKQPGFRLYTSGLWNLDRGVIEKIGKTISGMDDEYTKSMYDFAGMSAVGTGLSSQILAVPDDIKNIYTKINHDLFGEIARMFLDPERSSQFLAGAYNNGSGTLSILEKRMCLNETFFQLMN